MRIPAHQIHQVMINFSKQLLERLGQPEIGPEASPRTKETEQKEEATLTDHVRREAVLRHVTREILSKITRWHHRKEDEEHHRRTCAVEKDGTENPSDRPFVYDVITENGEKSRRQMTISGKGCPSAGYGQGSPGSTR